MKKQKTLFRLALSCAAMLSTSAFAYSSQSLPSFENDAYLLKMGIGNLRGTQTTDAFVPAINIAKRFEIHEAAIEISMSYAEQSNDHRQSKYWSFPKLTYLVFHEPHSANSLYYGGGVSWSKVKQRNDATPQYNGSFEGLFLEGTLGYELHRDQKIRTTFELNISQPVAESTRHGKHPGPSVFATIGFGFL